MAMPMTKEELHRLVDELPDGELVAAARFLEYLRERRPDLVAPPQRKPREATEDASEAARPQGSVYPTVSVPVAAVRELVDTMPDVGGDALQDTEALYDDV